MGSSPMEKPQTNGLGGFMGPGLGAGGRERGKGYEWKSTEHLVRVSGKCLQDLSLVMKSHR